MATSGGSMKIELCGGSVTGIVASFMESNACGMSVVDCVAIHRSTGSPAKDSTNGGTYMQCVSTARFLRSSLPTKFDKDAFQKKSAACSRSLAIQLQGFQPSTHPFANGTNKPRFVALPISCRLSNGVSRMVCAESSPTAATWKRAQSTRDSRPIGIHCLA